MKGKRVRVVNHASRFFDVDGVVVSVYKGGYTRVKLDSGEFCRLHQNSLSVH